MGRKEKKRKKMRFVGFYLFGSGSGTAIGMICHIFFLSLTCPYYSSRSLLPPQEKKKITLGGFLEPDR